MLCCLPTCRQVNTLQSAVLAGDWATATQQLGQLDMHGSHALQVGLAGRAAAPVALQLR